MPIHVGDIAPDLLSFGAPSQPAKLPDISGRWVVLFFYPKGNHPHCVMESRRFQLLIAEFQRLGVQVIGVSVDSAEEQQQFSTFCKLDFPLISDARHRISTHFGVLSTAEVDGQQMTYARRETFLLGPDRRIVHHWTDVDPHVHAAQVLDYLTGHFVPQTV